MHKQTVGHLIVFRDEGNGDEVMHDDVLVEATDFSKSGWVELAFTAGGLSKKPRMYLRVSLPELLEIAMALRGTDD